MTPKFYGPFQHFNQIKMRRKQGKRKKEGRKEERKK